MSPSSLKKDHKKQLNCMADYFKKNLGLIQKYFPKLFTQISSIETKDQYRIESSSLGTIVPELNLKFDHNSRAGFEAFHREKKIFFIYGLGDGDYLRLVRDASGAEEIFVIEPSIKWFQTALANFDLSDLLSDHRLYFVVGDNTDNYYSDIYNYFQQKAVRFYYAGFLGNLVTPGSQHLPGQTDCYIKFSEELKRTKINYLGEIKQRINQDGYYGFVNAVRNIKKYSQFKSVTDLRGLFKEVPAVVVGSGPSLKYSLSYLREIQDRVLIISSDSTFKTLIKEGIEPHFVFCLERAPRQASYYVDVDPSIRTVLGGPIIIHPEVFENAPAECVALRRNVGFDSLFFSDEPNYYLGRVVCHSCMVAASVLGCSEVMLVGIDHALDPTEQDLNEGFYHKSTNEDLKKYTKNILMDHLEKINGIFEITGYDGKPKTTHYYWYSNIECFKKIIDEHKIKVKNVIPITHGIPIDGTFREDPEYLSNFKNTEIHNAWTLIKENIVLRKTNQDYKTVISKSINFLENVINKMAEESTKLLRHYYRFPPEVEGNLEKIYDYFDNLDNMRSQLITGSEGYFIKLLVPVFLNEHANIEYAMREIFTIPDLDEVDKVIKKMNLYQDWFNSVIGWSSKMLVELRKASGEYDP